MPDEIRSRTTDEYNPSLGSSPNQPPLAERERAHGQEAKPDGAPSTVDGPKAPLVPFRPPLLPDYELLEELGRGGMAVVYKARYHRLKRTVALKMVLGGSFADPDMVRRFQAEAEAVARLQHPNIVTIFDVGEHGGLPYLSLEYLEGGSLTQRLRTGPMPPRAAAELVAVLATAVHHAHQRHIVHRDLKPGNVLFTSDGTPKVTDFGIAKQLKGAGGTQTGAVLGTPYYMAPEQAAGKTRAIGPATDVYALGVILYELLTGTTPFRSDDVIQILLQVITEEPVPPSQVRPGCPADLEAICLRCVRKAPEQRYSSAEELAQDLRRFLAGKRTQALASPPLDAIPRQTTIRSRRMLLSTGAAFALLALAFLAYFVLSKMLPGVSPDEWVVEIVEQAESQAVSWALPPGAGSAPVFREGHGELPRSLVLGLQRGTLLAQANALPPPAFLQQAPRADPKPRLDDPAVRARAREVRQLLESHCAKCHGYTRRIKDLNVLDRISLLDANRRKNLRAPAINLERPEASDLLERARDDMPPEGEGDKIPADKLALITQWIRDGAYYPTEPLLVPATAAPVLDLPPDEPPPAFLPAQPQMRRPLSEEVAVIFRNRCSYCHGGSKPDAGFRIMDQKELIEKHLITPGKTGGKLTSRLLADDSLVMPPVGRGLTRLSQDEIGTIGKWIEQGASPFDALISPEPGLVGHEYVLSAIGEDVRRLAGEGEPAAAFRYFSLNHLLGGGITVAQLEKHRKAFVLALNHLTWKNRFAIPQPIEKTATVFRVDLRSLGWDATLFQRGTEGPNAANPLTVFDLVLLEYPYGLVSPDLASYATLVEPFLEAARQVRPVPYLRADWFIAVATQPPLYYDLLRLPDRLADLEKALGVDARHNVERSGAMRAGLLISGVSPSNRVVERHEGTATSYYWRTHDFATSKGRSDIFADPIRLQPAGAAALFALPNGLQGYFLADGSGNRLDAASPSLLADKFAADHVARPGLSCLRCHDAGLVRFEDNLRPAMEQMRTSASSFSREDVMRLYPDRPKMLQRLDEDARRFLGALAQLFAEFEKACPPPQLRNPSMPTGAVLQEAAERFLNERVTRLVANSESARGADQLDVALRSPEFAWLAPLVTGGAIRRERWEEGYDQVVRTLGLGLASLPVDALACDELPGDRSWTFSLRAPSMRSATQALPQLRIVNKTRRSVHLEVILNASGGRKALAVSGPALVEGGKERVFSAAHGTSAWHADEVRTLTVFACDVEFPPGQLVRGDRIVDRVVHPVYTLQRSAKGRRPAFDPARLTKQTIQLDER